MPFQLVNDSISHNTVEALRELLALAERGEITGIAFACSMRQKRYMTNTAGYCFKNPTFTRGMVCALADEVGEMVRAENALL